MLQHALSLAGTAVCFMEFRNALLLLLLLDIKWHSLAGLKFELERHVTGLRTENYLWNEPVDGLDWIAAKNSALIRSGLYVALSYALPAQQYWGQRVQLQAVVASTGLGYGAEGALFVRVAGVDGRTMAMDNMNLRPIRNWEWASSPFSVVVDVPGPPPSDGDVCVLEEYLPAHIHVGFLLVGGAGFITLEQSNFGVVGKDVPVTGGPPPWRGPPEM